MSQTTEGTLSLSGRLDAIKISRVQERVLTDEIGVSDGKVATVTSGANITAVRVADSGAHSVSADLVPSADDTVLTVTGPPSVGESSIAVCRLLVERLNRDGGEWGEPQDLSYQGGRLEKGIDFLVPARMGCRELHVQVVRANPSQGLWRSISRVGRVSGRYSVNELAEALKSAIKGKLPRIPPRDRQSITLALDAILIANHAFYSVINRFRERNLAWTTGLGFASVWCIGPVPELVWRLDAAGNE